MNKSFFIIDSNEIKEKKKSLLYISTYAEAEAEANCWDKVYEDKTTNEKWIEYRMEPEYHGGGYPMLVRQPEPNTNELIEIALDSENLKEIAGASVFLYTNEKYDQVDFRIQLINAVEKFIRNKKGELSELEKSKLNIIIHDSHLSDPTNRRTILGKHFSEIEKDYHYFKVVSERTKLILSEIK